MFNFQIERTQLEIRELKDSLDLDESEYDQKETQLSGAKEDLENFKRNKQNEDKLHDHARKNLERVQFRTKVSKVVAYCKRLFLVRVKYVLTNSDNRYCQIAFVTVNFSL